MTISATERPSDSPFVESISHGITLSAGSSIRPAEYHWHMVFVKEKGNVHPLMVGPLGSSGLAHWGEGGEILWIKFKLGTFMPHMPVKSLLDSETELPDASSKTFYLKGASWQFPDYENVDTFIDRLVRSELLVRDPIVSAALADELPDISLRTVRHRFLQSTGLAHNQIRQIQRARRAEALLLQGMSILDTVFEAGYFDQPHLTRSLKQWVGYTPAELARRAQTKACHSVQDAPKLLSYHTTVLETEMIG
jgi:AraC-like DNA-binding protein